MSSVTTITNGPPCRRYMDDSSFPGARRWEASPSSGPTSSGGDSPTRRVGESGGRYEGRSASEGGERPAWAAKTAATAASLVTGGDIGERTGGRGVTGRGSTTPARE